MMVFKQAAIAHQVHFLRKAALALEKVRAGGFDLPDDVTLAVQAIMDKIPKIIRRLEDQLELTGTEPIGHSRSNEEDLTCVK